MNNSAEPLRVLIDTTFLLPTLGIDTGKRTTRALKRLAEVDAEIYYSSFSLLESLWVAARSVGDSTFDSVRFSEGLRSVMDGGTYVKLDESSEIFTRAMQLYRLGHRDVIDNILYASSVHFGLKFLTVDGPLRDFIQEKELERTLMSVNDLS